MNGRETYGSLPAVMSMTTTLTLTMLIPVCVSGRSADAYLEFSAYRLAEHLTFVYGPVFHSPTRPAKVCVRVSNIFVRLTSVWVCPSQTCSLT